MNDIYRVNRAVKNKDGDEMEYVALIKCTSYMFIGLRIP